MESANLKKTSFKRRVGTMLRTDLKRMARSRLFYILLICALLIPVIMTVMMTMMDGTETVDPQTGAVSVMEGPENVWQSIGTLPTAEGAAMGGMDVMSMCNINMMFMLAAVFICLFVSDDFRSGFAKNLFTVREGKGDYVLSKTVVGFICGGLMLVLYFIGALIGGGISGLSFEPEGFTPVNLLFCMLSKIFLMLVFVAIFLLISVAAKKTAWLSVIGSIGGGMLLFMTVPMMTPLNSAPINLLLCAAGGILFACGLGLASRLVLKKTALV